MRTGIMGPLAGVLLGLAACAGAATAGDPGPWDTTTDGPEADVATADVPTTDVPTTDVPASDAPATDAPAADVAVDGTPGDPPGPDVDTLGATCLAREDCGTGQFCRRPDGACAGPGTCTERPADMDCGDIGPAACGCDGQNYGGRCWANHFGVNLRSTKACPIGTACADGAADTCPEGSWCRPQEGTCGTAGFCEIVPLECPEEDYPVCGCDDHTHAGPCHAGMAMVGILRSKACGSMAPCATNATCPAVEFCSKPPASCDASIVGKCDVRPGDCQMTRAFAPQCGCDGESYSNACWVAAGGTTIAKAGECPGDTLCWANDPCGQGQYCRKKDGICDTGFGVCRPIPGDCPASAGSPVCGCDLVAYPDACKAGMAGRSVKHAGDCNGPSDSFVRYFYADDAESIDAMLRIVKGPNEILQYGAADTFQEALDPSGGAVTLTVRFQAADGPAAGHGEVRFTLSLPPTLPYGMGLGYQGSYVRWFDAADQPAGDLGGMILVSDYVPHGAAGKVSTLRFSGLDLTLP